MKEVGFIRKISKFVTSKTEQQTISIHISPDISRSKDNCPINFGHLIEYNMRNISLKNNGRKVVQEVVPDHFLKNKY